ncbi:hypothetical protein [Streptomyces canus]|uniref:hypothetical protein n=1 Tax=Streptomyces canus TaxID=58343 RepID=UPI0027D91C67|nr:hypothetical protein [Streptomyces canus]
MVDRVSRSLGDELFVFRGQRTDLVRQEFGIIIALGLWLPADNPARDGISNIPEGRQIISHWGVADDDVPTPLKHICVTGGPGVLVNRVILAAGSGRGMRNQRHQAVYGRHQAVNGPKEKPRQAVHARHRAVYDPEEKRHHAF